MQSSVDVAADFDRQSIHHTFPFSSFPFPSFPGLLFAFMLSKPCMAPTLGRDPFCTLALSLARLALSSLSNFVNSQVSSSRVHLPLLAAHMAHPQMNANDYNLFIYHFYLQ